ncbi:MAG TPA: reductive dehalogenase [Anaerolineae bacterium]|nr:reductive dehalogenase [Anaerolineae bacterium]
MSDRKRNNRLSRRDFLKGVGAIMGATGVASITRVNPVGAKPDRTNTNGLTTHKRKYKYPWWVKTVDKITTEVNPDIATKPPMVTFATYAQAMIPDEEWDINNSKAKEYVKEGIINNIPGRTLPDLALHYALHSDMTLGSMGSFDSPRTVKIKNHEELVTYNLHPPRDFDLDPWQASPEEASRVLEAAGIQFGASMVGFTKLNPDWIYPYVKFEPGITEPVMDIKNMSFRIPESYKYVVLLITQGPRDLLIRNQSELGAAGDRATYSRMFNAGVQMARFIKGLDYGYAELLAAGPIIPFALEAGLGELGRMNRLINPIFGGNIRITGFLTDLPLAPDKPIDFGLQEFCKTCKICASECPAGALSMADEPYWIPANAFQASGKKVYFEDNLKCAKYITERGNYCSTCLSVCPWSKQDKAALHEIAKVTSVIVPSSGNFLSDMDQAFGYGLIREDDPEMEDWWDLDIPEEGIDSYQGKA